MEKEINMNFLKLAGFEPDEIHEYLSEWDKASKRLGLTSADVKFATEQWIPTHFDVKLEGVRKSIGSYIKEAIDLTKAKDYKKKGVKIVYGIMPAHLTFYQALKLTAPDKVYICFPDIFIIGVLQRFFHKINPYLVEAEKAGIPYGCRHCALNKTRYAARRFGLIPSPDINWIWGFVCDEGPKSDEFICEYYDPEWKTYITHMPRDQPLGTIEDEVDERVEYLANQMRDGFKAVQKEVGIEVSDDMVTKAVNIRFSYVCKLGEIYANMGSDPQPLGGLDGALPNFPRSTPFNTGIESMENALDILLKEVKQRVAKKEGILPKGAPKLAMHFMPYVTWVVKMFEKNGVGVPFTEATLPSKKELVPPRFKDPYWAAAETWLKTGDVVNLGYKAQLISEKLETYKLDGMIFGFMDFDRWLGSDNRLLAKMVEKRTKLPIYYVEGDLWEDRDYSPEALATRIETIVATVKMHKATKE